MDGDYFIGVAQQALWILALACGADPDPGAVAGLILGMVQAATSINEQTLTFVPEADRGRRSASPFSAARSWC